MSHNQSRSPLISALTGAIMLFGIGFLLAVDAVDFWPWILAVIALAMLPGMLTRGGLATRLGGALASAWLIALAAILDAGALWPGILILIAIPVVIRLVGRTVSVQKSVQK